MRLHTSTRTNTRLPDLTTLVHVHPRSCDPEMKTRSFSGISTCTAPINDAAFPYYTCASSLSLPIPSRRLPFLHHRLCSRAKRAPAKSARAKSAPGSCAPLWRPSPQQWRRPCLPIRIILPSMTSPSMTPPSMTPPSCHSPCSCIPFRTRIIIMTRVPKLALLRAIRTPPLTPPLAACVPVSRDEMAARNRKRPRAEL